jgi:pimeloyl-ACP methyl ester carboxylesterase
MNKKEVNISFQGIDVKANLTIPGNPEALVIFSHGSGSSRHSPRNNYVADVLNKQGIATLLADLLTPDEDADYENRFNISLLSKRLVKVTEWAQQHYQLKALPAGYFGASTGAGSALRAAVQLDNHIKAIVSRGGRPDLTGKVLPLVKSPTLLIVGSFDTQAISLNYEAYNELTWKKEIVIVDGASHLFEEPGKLQEVAELAANWFVNHLVEANQFIQENKMAH